ncbi:MAG: adenosylhomocysteinase [Caldisericia bacterium]|jgi:adenosylhomocysteinase|nr:adenosylhomocysteinase [Caldisericia bacterium]
MDYDILDISLNKKGLNKILWAKGEMKVLNEISERFKKEKPFKGLKIACSLHITSETANLVVALKEGGAEVFLCASNPLSTKDDVAASLVKDFGIPVFGIRGEDKEKYFNHIEKVILIEPDLTVDDGGDLTVILHEKFKYLTQKIIGGTEETTTGVIRLKSMEREKLLAYPIIAVNNAKTKRFFDNRFGTGQSTIDGLLRATNILLSSKTLVVIGFGFCGKGIAERARGMGAHVIVCEVDPIKALEAYMEGYDVMKIEKSLLYGDIFITATGNKNVITKEHILKMKDGAILGNSGHFNVEIDVEGLNEISIEKKEIRDNLTEHKLINGKKVYLISHGRLMNLGAAEGHPSSVMDMSFANQALSLEYLLKNKGVLQNKVYDVPQEIDKEVAKIKLKTLGIEIDSLTEEQEKYLMSWKID